MDGRNLMKILMLFIWNFVKIISKILWQEKSNRIRNLQIRKFSIALNNY